MEGKDVSETRRFKDSYYTLNGPNVMQTCLTLTTDKETPQEKETRQTWQTRRGQTCLPYTVKGGQREHEETQQEIRTQARRKLSILICT